MRRSSALALLTAGAALSLSLTAAPAFAKGGGDGGGGGGGRPCGPAVSTSGTGSLGSPWTLKSMHDDNAAGMPIVGEEFEINTPAGQTWTVTFADDGTTFFSGNEVAPAGGIVVNSSTANLAGTQTMSVTAVNPATGETISGSVALPPAPSTCHSG
jgi:hypothetical protein